MKCVIPGPNLKVFGKAIHSLSKIGEEIYFEAQSDGLAVRTVNSSRSAYMSFFFKVTFFQKFSDRVSNSDKSSRNQEDASESLRCKVYTKSCLAVFKSLVSLEKSVEKCVLFLDLKEDRFIFQLHCRHGLTKTFNLTFIECERLNAIYKIEDCSNVMMAQSRLLSEVAGNFQPNVEEMNMSMSELKVTVNNHIEESDASKILRTEVELLPDEFEEYNVVLDTQVVFCLKEFRALLFFSEGPNLPLSIYVKEAGEPIIFVLDSDPTFCANLVLATLPSFHFSKDASAATVAAASTRKKERESSTTTTKLRRKKAAEKKSKRPDNEEELNAGDFDESRRIENLTVFNPDNDRLVANEESDDEDIGHHPKTWPSRNLDENATNVTQPPSSSRNNCGPLTANGKQGSSKQATSRERMSENLNKFSEDVFPSMSRNKRRADDSDVDSTLRESSKNVAATGGRAKRNVNEVSNKAAKNKPCEIFKPFSEENDDGGEKESQTLVERDDENSDDDDDDDIVPGTPPRSPPNKKFRALFFGLSQSQESSSIQSELGRNENIEYEVLAEDTDPE